jgi:hypothetical protein
MRRAVLADRFDFRLELEYFFFDCEAAVLALEDAEAGAAEDAGSVDTEEASGGTASLTGAEVSEGDVSGVAAFCARSMPLSISGAGDCLGTGAFPISNPFHAKATITMKPSRNLSNQRGRCQT